MFNEIEQLRDRAVSLASRFENISMLLRSGVVPSGEDEFTQLRDLLVEVRRLSEVCGITDSGVMPDLLAIGHRLEDLTTSFLRLSSPNSTIQQELELIRRRVLTEGQLNISSWINIDALLRLASNDAAIPWDEYDALETLVETAFGKSIRQAAVRGLLSGEDGAAAAGIKSAITPTSATEPESASGSAAVNALLGDMDTGISVFSADPDVCISELEGFVSDAGDISIAEAEASAAQAEGFLADASKGSVAEAEVFVADANDASDADSERFLADAEGGSMPEAEDLLAAPDRSIEDANGSMEARTERPAFEMPLEPAFSESRQREPADAMPSTAPSIPIWTGGDLPKALQTALEPAAYDPAVLSPVSDAEVRSEGPVSSAAAPQGHVNADRVEARTSLEESVPVDELARRTSADIGRVLSERPSLAYYIARAGEAAGLALPLRATTIRTYLLASAIDQPTGPVVETLRDDFAALEAGRGSRNGTSPDTLLLSAAALRPVLFAPLTGASGVQRNLTLPAAYGELVRSIVHHADLLQGLDRTSLIAAQSDDAWHSAENSIKARIREWLTRARASRVIYQAATAVLREWVRDGGFLAAPLSKALDERYDDVDNVSRFIAETTQKAIDRTIDNIDRAFRRQGQQRIEGTARQSLREHAKEATLLLEEWVKIVSVRPAPGNYVETESRKLLADFRRLLPAAEAELQALSREGDILPEVATMTLTTLADVSALLSGAPRPNTRDTNPADLINIELLRTNIALTPEGQPVREPSLIDLSRACETSISWQAAFKNRLDMKDYPSAERILGILEDSIDSGTIDSLRAAFDRELDTFRSEVAHQRSRARADIEKALTDGLITDGQRNDFLIRVSVADGEARDARSVAIRAENVSAVYAELSRTRDERKREIKIVLETAAIPDTDRSRIESAIDRGLLRNASEYLNIARDGGILPAEDSDSGEALTIFFPKCVEGLARELKVTTEYTQISDSIRAGTKLGGVDFSRVDSSQVDNLVGVSNAWFRVRRDRKVDRSSLRSFLAFLGLDVRDDIGSSTGHRLTPVFDIPCEPIANRDLIPIPEFGSQAAGNYRIVCMLDLQGGASRIFDQLESWWKPGTIVFAFGSLSVEQRLNLASKSRQQKKTVLVIDDFLFTYLLSQPPNRLAAMFSCALAFTWTRPFTIAAGLVPSETFYGRHSEMQDLLDPFGTCIIYGGRQLGKTALLRQVERSYHKPRDGQIAVWIDLKAENLAPSAIEGRLLSELKRQGVDTLQSAQKLTTPRSAEELRKWLHGSTQRQIIFLLDEADSFIERDATDDFRTVSALKLLMDVTNRRFKVVFAGLHNVIRTAAQANHPLAHFGTPRNIGPLFANGDWRSALALIQEPLGAVGFNVSTDVGFTILSQTNYYPSLIQLYGRSLLDKAYSKSIGRNEPPTVVPVSMVDDVYHNNSELRAEIANRLKWTLELDDRYLVIAYSFAFALRTGQISPDEGVLADDVFRLALSAWPMGFQNLSRNGLVALLDEMIGLGILRKDEDRYTFRSPNVPLLLGTADDIFSVLASERPKPEPYDADRFREANANHDLSPFTSRQLGTLRASQNGVSVLLDSVALGSDLVPEFLRRSGPFTHVSACRDLAEFQKQCDTLQRKREEGTSVFLIGATNPWDATWVDYILGRSRSYTADRRYARFVFQAPPSQAWELIQDSSLHRLERSGCEIIALERWHPSATRDWVRDCQYQLDAPGEQRLIEITNGLPWLLYLFRDEMRKQVRAKEALEELERLMQTGELKERYRAAIGVGDTSDFALVATTLTVMAGAGDALDPDFLAELIAEEYRRKIDREMLGKVLVFAERLSLARRRPDESWQLEPDVATAFAG